MRVMIVICFLMVVLSCASPGQRGDFREIVVGGKTITYRFQSCAPSFRWDGYQLAIEELEFPSNAPNSFLDFKVGKIGYEPQVLRSINASVARYDSMMQAACTTLIRLKEEENILKYSQFRDKVFTDLIRYLDKLDSANREDEVIGEIEGARRNIEANEATFEKL